MSTAPSIPLPAEAAPAEAPPRKRIDALDVARGTAITLMILSHGVKGLLDFSQFPDWGLVPVHAITKFASSLFILVFGMALAVTCKPVAGTDAWPKRRKSLMLRGLYILFWYKLLTIVEMAARFSEQEILDALLWKSFPVFVEILGFYGLALLWLPLVLPLWFRAPLVVRLAVPVVLAALSVRLAESFDFWGNESIRAILVEHDEHYTWGQLSRAPLVFLGLLAGELVLSWNASRSLRLRAALLFGAAAAALWAAFLAQTAGSRAADLLSIAHNDGKHPPEATFMTWSVAGAATLLALAFLGGREAAVVLRPLTMIGRNALVAFIVHAIVLCVFYRHRLGYFRTVSYEEALKLTGVMFLVTWAVIEIWSWLRRFLLSRSR